MNGLEKMLPVIIRERDNFNCFGVSGSIDTLVSDQGTKEFSTKVIVNALGQSATMDLTLKGNETFEHTVTVPVVGEITIKVVISNWQVSEGRLSFHVKGDASKWIIGCQFINRTMSGNRYNQAAFEEVLATALQEVEKSVNG